MIKGQQIKLNMIKYVNKLALSFSIILGYCGLVVCFPDIGITQEDLSVIEKWRQYSDAKNALYNEIAREAYRFLDERDTRISAIRTKEQWRNYISSIYEKLRKAFGPMPEKTPLNARVTGVFEHEGITVEKIIYESRPGFWVTACLFKRADLDGKLPAVLYLCGHTSDGFRSETYQHVILNLARKGFVVFTVDPVGQGERLQYYDAEKDESVIGGPTSEHSYAGVQYLLLGRTMAMVRLWDCIRALDYLVERPDVDPERIGVHGRSGGGTMSSYIGAMDSRIAAAAPECYITNFRRIFQSIGPQDAEQNLLGQISIGLDHGDFLIARAPRPTLVIATTRDFFSIHGVHETVRDAQPAFDAFGLDDNLCIVEDDAAHQSTKNNRERMYAFFMNTFGVKGNSLDEDIPPIDAAHLQVTLSGQTITSGSKTIYDIIRAEAIELLDNLDESRKSLDEHREKVRNASMKLSGIKIPDSTSEAIFNGRFRREGYSIEKVIIGGVNGMPIPSLVFVPERSGKHPAVLYLSHKGKEANAEVGGLIESLVKSGYLVMASDLPGCGELTVNTHNDDSVIKGVSYNLIFGAQLIGRSVTGIQAGCILKAKRYLISRSDVNADDITAVSRGFTGTALIHAAVFDSEIHAVALIESPVSWESLMMHRFYDQSIGSTIVPSAMLYYDLPDLLGVLAPRRVLIIDSIDGDARPAPENLDKTIMKYVEPFYKANLRNFMIIKSDKDRSYGDILSQWLKKNE